MTYTRQRHMLSKRKRITRRNKKHRKKSRKRMIKQKRRRTYRKKRRSQQCGGQKSILYQLFTDVDDTLHPAGYLWTINPKKAFKAAMSGVDHSGSRDELYKCVRQLHTNIFNYNLKKKQKVPTVVISANPMCSKEQGAKEKKIMLFASEDIKKGASVNYFKGCWLTSGGPIITDIFWKLLQQTDNKSDAYLPMAEQKVLQITNAVEQMRSRLPQNYDYRAIWIGDNGQGDLLAAKTLLANEIIYAAFIHYVDPRKQSGKSSTWTRTDKRLFSFKNYAQMIKQLKVNIPGLEEIESCKDNKGALVNPKTETPHYLKRKSSFIRAEEKELADQARATLEEIKRRPYASRPVINVD